jgi:hypothetical protein
MKKVTRSEADDAARAFRRSQMIAGRRLRETILQIIQGSKLLADDALDSSTGPVNSVHCQAGRAPASPCRL